MKQLLRLLIVVLFLSGSGATQFPEGLQVFSSELSAQVDPQRTGYVLRKWTNEADYAQHNGMYFIGTPIIYMAPAILENPRMRSIVLAHEVVHLWESLTGRLSMTLEPKCVTNPWKYGFTSGYDPDSVTLNYWCLQTEVHARYYSMVYYVVCNTATGPLGDPRGRSCKDAPNIEKTLLMGIKNGLFTKPR